MAEKLTAAQKAHRKAVIGALFSAGDRVGAMSLMRGMAADSSLYRRFGEDGPGVADA